MKDLTTWIWDWTLRENLGLYFTMKGLIYVKATSQRQKNKIMHSENIRTKARILYKILKWPWSGNEQSKCIGIQGDLTDAEQDSG